MQNNITFEQDFGNGELLQTISDSSRHKTYLIWAVEVNLQLTTACLITIGGQHAQCPNCYTYYKNFI
jgi:hypothetical protein